MSCSPSTSSYHICYDCDLNAMVKNSVSSVPNNTGKGEDLKYLTDRCCGPITNAHESKIDPKSNLTYQVLPDTRVILIFIVCYY